MSKLWEDYILLLIATERLNGADEAKKLDQAVGKVITIGCIIFAVIVVGTALFGKP